MQFPTSTTRIPAPPVVNTGVDERAPAWSPDGTKLAFLREGAGAHFLMVFDLNSGVQDILNDGIAVGFAPTAQLRKFQSVEGDIALATETRPDSTAASCTSSCIAGLRNLTLSPTVTGRPPISTKIGIIVAKVTGTTTLFGKKVPKIKQVGRVPLGKVKKGKNTFKWDGKVNHRKLKKGNYLLTFRLLDGKRVRSTSKSVPFKVAR
jgi:hypothetical protein